MAIRTGSIVLATTRFFTGRVPLRGRYTIQMKSENLSGNTDWSLQISADGVEFKNAQEAGVDITGSLVDETVEIKTYEGNPGDAFKILFAGATTGTVDYIINGA